MSQSKKPAATTVKESAEALTDVGKKIIEVKQIIVNWEKEICHLEKKRGMITNHLENAGAYLKKTKNKSTKFNKSRRKSGGGIETQMFWVLKNMYGVKLQAYHGGNMTGDDIQKVMSNADEIFSILQAFESKRKARLLLCCDMEPSLSHAKLDLRPMIFCSKNPKDGVPVGIEYPTCGVWNETQTYFTPTRLETKQ